MSGYQVGDTVQVETFLDGKRYHGTGVVQQLPRGSSPYYALDIGTTEPLLVPPREILGVTVPRDASPAKLLEWLRS